MVDVLKKRNNTYLFSAQILSITADNASNNDKMIQHLSNLIESFPGAANQTRCFAHILNLVAKSILRQFEGPKVTNDVDKSMDDAAKAVSESDELDDEDGDVSDDVDDDNEDGLPDEREKMTEEALVRLEKSVKPIRLLLTKVSQFKLLFR
jgi:hypothetical protein